jgi:hypothetical protein
MGYLLCNGGSYSSENSRITISLQRAGESDCASFLLAAAEWSLWAASFGHVDSSLNHVCQSSASSDLKMIGEGIV